MKILDCTLRDGGYYTNWDFEESIVENYLNSMNNLPVDIIEIGYRSAPKDQYLGEYFYCPTYVMQKIRSRFQKKIAIMLNEKDTSIDDLPMLLGPCEGYVDIVRMAVNPDNFDRAIDTAQAIKERGFEVVNF